MPNINAVQRFARVPDIEKPRSIFTQATTHKTSANVGQVIPIYVNFLYPGTTVKMNIAEVIRMQTMLTPIMDNIYADIHCWFVPMRLTWTHTKEFFGENSESAWIPQTTYQVPSISAPSGGFETGTLADYMGLPVGVEWSNSDPRRPMALPFRAYALIMNEFFRSENITDPLNIPVGDSNQTGSNGSSYINDVANGGKPFMAAKFFDRFTGALPTPQKGPAVQFGTSAAVTVNSLAPVGVTDYAHDANFSDTENISLAWSKGTSTHIPTFNSAPSGSTTYFHNSTGKTLTIDDDNKLTGWYDTSPVYPENLYADLNNALSVSGVSFSINELRLAFQLQRYYEAIARSGSRYVELIHGLWGVESDDARMQRPEYLGGKRIPIQIHEVINTAQATNDYLGDLGAMSHTADADFMFEYSTREHGFLMVTCVLRYDHSYAQGIERFWSRLDRESYYIPQFANIGEQPLYQDELCATSTNMATETVFGYQEAWSDLRYGPQPKITGEMRPGITNTLASWHLSDYYESAPTLSDSWLREDPNIVDRVLAVGSSVSNQYFADFYFDVTETAVLPMYSVPGLIDHF